MSLVMNHFIKSLIIFLSHTKLTIFLKGKSTIYFFSNTIKKYQKVYETSLIYIQC